MRLLIEAQQHPENQKPTKTKIMLQVHVFMELHAAKPKEEIFTEMKHQGCTLYTYPLDSWSVIIRSQVNNNICKEDHDANDVGIDLKLSFPQHAVDSIVQDENCWIIKKARRKLG